MPTVHLPVIDFAPFARNEGIVVGEEPTLSQRTVASEIDAACRDHGFVYLTNLGIDPATPRAAFDSAEELFALPEETKIRDLVRCSPDTNIGYSPFRSEHINRKRAADLKEAFNVRRPCPLDENLKGCPDAFVTAAELLWNGLERMAKRYALACALALGVEHDFFLRTLQRLDMCTLRTLHYPPCDIRPHLDAEPDGGEASAVRVGEHTDFGMFTVLFLRGGPEGLQIKSVVGGEVGGNAGGEVGGWMDLDIPISTTPGAVINTGALLARWTNDVWRATAHRVVVPSARMAARHRYSMAFFVDPDAEAVIDVHPKFVRDGVSVRYGPTTGREYVLGKLRSAQLGE